VENVELEKDKEDDVGDVGNVEESAVEAGDDEEDDEQLGIHEDDHGDVDEDEDEDEDDDDISVERDEDDERPTKPQLPQTDTGTTLFIRNIPFVAMEDELRTLYVDLFPHYAYTHHFMT
jgi:nucleolar protein 4